MGESSREQINITFIAAHCWTRGPIKIKDNMCLVITLCVQVIPCLEEVEHQKKTWMNKRRSSPPGGDVGKRIRRNIRYLLEWLAATHSLFSQNIGFAEEGNTFNEFHSIKTMVPIFIIIPLVWRLLLFFRGISKMKNFLSQRTRETTNLCLFPDQSWSSSGFCECFLQTFNTYSLMNWTGL